MLLVAIMSSGFYIFSYIYIYEISFIFISFVFRGKFQDMWKHPFKLLCIAGQFLNPNVSI